MPQFFHPRWNVFARLSLYGGPVVLIAVCCAAWLAIRSPGATEVNVPVEQPIPFSHEYHVGRLGLDCRYCHASVEQSGFAGIPATDVCMQCHKHVWTGLRAVEFVKASDRTGIPLAWLRLHDLPDYARFDHGIHVQKGVACVTCHGRVDQMPVVWKAQTLHMQWCLECHRRPEKYVRPREEVFNMDWQPPVGDQAWAELGRRLKIDPCPANSRELGLALVEKYRIKRSTSCSNCHQ